MITRADVTPEIAAASRASNICPACGGTKPAGSGACGECWRSLTEPQRQWLLSLKQAADPAGALFMLLVQCGGLDDEELHLGAA